MNRSFPILTAAAMRDAEQAAAHAGTPLATLMERAGSALARLAWRMAAGRPVHILAGPGNNGGDGYVAARHLASLGATVTVSALADSATDLARQAAANWAGPVGRLSDPPVANALLIDCLFGTGLSRSLDAETAQALRRHVSLAARSLAADVPSGVATDNGADLGCPYHADMTLAFGALKPAHVLFPAADRMGRVVLDDLGLMIDSRMATAAMPSLTAPDFSAHKYVRGLVTVVAGSMAGAAELAARAALRAGAGYVRLLGSGLPPTPPFAIVRQGWREGMALDDERIGAIVIGCGLGQGDQAQARLDAARATGKPLLIDADGLFLLGNTPLDQPAILTPHPGEFARLAGKQDGADNKLSITARLAEHLNAVVVHKGPDTVIAAPDGRVAVASPGNSWLSTAGTGDVLAGIAGAMLARGLPPFEAAQAAVLLHQRAAQQAQEGFAADDLVKGPLWP